MALWYATGFDEFANPSTYYLTTATGLVPDNDWLIDTTGGRVGGAALTNSVSGGNSHFNIFPGWNGRQATIGFAYKFSQGGKANIIAQWVGLYPDGTIKQVVKIGMDASNILYIDLGDGGIVRGTKSLLSGRYYYIEWMCQVSAINALVVDVTPPSSQPPTPPYTYYSAHYSFLDVPSHSNQLRVNGVLEVDQASSLVVGYTQGGAYVFPRSPTLGNNSNVPYAMLMGDLWLMYDQFQLQNWFDDFYFINNVNADATTSPNCSFLGDVSVQNLRVATSGTPTTGDDTFSLAAGSTKQAAVREIEPDGDASYIEAAADGNRQTFYFSSIRTGATTIPGAVLNVVCRKDDAHDRGVGWIYNQGANLNESPAGVGFIAPDKYRQMRIGLNHDPSNAAWTESVINALEAGVKSIDSASITAAYYQDGYSNGQVPNS